MSSPQPGDFAVVTAGGLPGRLVKLAELANGSGPWADYQHAFIYIGEGQIIQAEPKGTGYAELTPHAKTLWSTGKIPLTGEQRDAVCDMARAYASPGPWGLFGRHVDHGVPYSFLDYVALIFHHYRIRVPRLRHFIASSNHQICSELVDSCYLAAGVHLFTDPPRWRGYVTPADLARLLTETDTTHV